MKIIFINDRAEKTRLLTLNGWARGLLSVCLLGIPVAAGTWLGMKIADGRWELLFENTVGEMREQLVVQRGAVDQGREQVDETLSAMTAKLAQMRSRLVRLDALGEQLTQIASLQDGEFDFSQSAGLGGPDERLDSEVTRSMSAQDELKLMFAALDNSLSDREAQLNVLQSMMSDHRLKNEATVAGRPVSYTHLTLPTIYSV